MKESVCMSKEGEINKCVQPPKLTWTEKSSIVEEAEREGLYQTAQKHSIHPAATILQWKNILEQIDTGRYNYKKAIKKHKKTKINKNL